VEGRDNAGGPEWDPETQPPNVGEEEAVTG
jgi:hypothetical protein